MHGHERAGVAQPGSAGGRTPFFSYAGATAEYRRIDHVVAFKIQIETHIELVQSHNPHAAHIVCCHEQLAGEGACSAIVNRLNPVTALNISRATIGAVSRLMMESPTGG